jgi:hypothetical protein
MSLLEHHPPHRQEDSGIGLNTVETCNRPRGIDYLTYGPTGQVNPFVDLEIISL